MNIGNKYIRFAITGLILLLVCATTNTAFAEASSSKTKNQEASTPVNDDIISFTQNIIFASMGSIDKIVLFWVKPKVKEQENYDLITAKYFSMHDIEHVTGLYARFCRDNNGDFEIIKQDRNTGMCLSNDHQKASFLYKGEQLDRMHPVEVMVTIHSANDGTFFSESFLKQEIDEGYRTPWMVQLENNKVQAEYSKARAEKDKELQIEIERQKQKLRDLSSLTREALLQIGSEACTFSPEKPFNVKRGYVDAINNNKIKIILDGDMTKITWTNVEEWFECSAL